jgi:hypothetical protein
MAETTILYRPVSAKEMRLIEESDRTAFQPGLARQPIFYPVLNEDYAIQIARDWNALLNEDKVGFVARFRVRTASLHSCQGHVVGGSEHLEYWIQAEQLRNFNENIVGKIEMIAGFREGQ